MNNIHTDLVVVSDLISVLCGLLINVNVSISFSNFRVVLLTANSNRSPITLTNISDIRPVKSAPTLPNDKPKYVH